MTDKRAELGRPKSIQPAGGYTLATTHNRIDETAGNADKLSSLSLEALALVANESAEEAANALAKTVEHAMRCGRALNAAKSRMEHGNWLPWLKTNFDRSVDTAALWMKLAANSERVRNLEEAPSIRAALRLIAADDAEATAEASCKVDDDINTAVHGNVDADVEAETTPPADTRPARQRSDVVDDAGDTGEDDAGDTDTIPEVIDLRAMAERLTEDYGILFEHSPKHANKALMEMVEAGLFLSMEPDTSGRVPESRWESAVQIIRLALNRGLPDKVQRKIATVMRRHKGVRGERTC